MASSQFFPRASCYQTLHFMPPMALFLYSNHSGFPNISREVDCGRCYVVRGEVKTELVFCSITVCYLPILVVVVAQDYITKLVQ